MAAILPAASGDPVISWKCSECASENSCLSCLFCSNCYVSRSAVASSGTAIAPVTNLVASSDAAVTIIDLSLLDDDATTSTAKQIKKKRTPRLSSVPGAMNGIIPNCNSYESCDKVQVHFNNEWLQGSIDSCVLSGVKVLFVDGTQTIVPHEEIDTRLRPDSNILNILCSACGNYAENMQLHPLLCVPICPSCVLICTTGTYKITKDGNEDRCRWCGDGGDLSLCDDCVGAFCSDCIERNFGEKKLSSISALIKWSCFGCRPLTLEFLRKNNSRLTVIGPSIVLQRRKRIKAKTKRPTLVDSNRPQAGGIKSIEQVLAVRKVVDEATKQKRISSIRATLADITSPNTLLRKADERRIALEVQLAVARKALATVDSEKLIFPANWTKQADDGCDRSNISWWRDGRTVVNINISHNSDEFGYVASRLKSSISEAVVTSVLRVENRLLWRRYFNKQKDIALKNNRISLNDEGGSANEVMMWHGTTKTDPKVILEHECGLDFRFSSAGFYGCGLYLAENARYSNAGYAYQNSDGTRSLLFVRAALGDTAKFDQRINPALKCPEINPRTGLLFDSISGGPHRPMMRGPGQDDSMMIIVYDLCQAYPEYIVNYALPSP